VGPRSSTSLGRSRSTLILVFFWVWPRYFRDLLWRLPFFRLFVHPVISRVFFANHGRSAKDHLAPWPCTTPREPGFPATEGCEFFCDKGFPFVRLSARARTMRVLRNRVDSPYTETGPPNSFLRLTLCMGHFFPKSPIKRLKGNHPVSFPIFSPPFFFLPVISRPLPGLYQLPPEAFARAQAPPPPIPSPPLFP